MSVSESWSEVGGALEREFRFRNFVEALAFVNRVGDLAEAEGHHHPAGQDQGGLKAIGMLLPYEGQRLYTHQHLDIAIRGKGPG